MNEIFEYSPTLVYIYTAIIGAMLGSFLNVVMARLPEKGMFFSNKRSFCPACSETIKWYDLFPVISWFILLGKCRSCKAQISFRYPIVELLGAALAVSAIYMFGFTPLALIIYPVLMILLAVSLIDFDTTEIPDSLIIALIPFSIAAIWLFDDVTLLSHIIGAFTISLPMLLIALLISGAFGGGDIKLMAVCGLFLGWQLTLLSFFIALILGGGVAAYLLLSGRRERGSHMVFGPALCIGITISIYFGKDIIDYYLSNFWI